VTNQVWMQVGCQVAVIALSSNVTILAQIVPDQALPVGERSQVSGTLNTQIDGGAIRGSNLFQSFQQFSVPTGGSAFFDNGSSIANIISRVTGGSVSNIDGLIRANGNANLFLINPNGILFGPNAQLNVGGSFIASTANSFVFDNGFAFSATDPQASPLLTVSVPVGLQYGSNPGAIQSQGARLRVPNGQTLTLAGGTVNVYGGQLLAPGGRVELASIAAPSEVGLTQQGQEWRLSVPKGLGRADVAIGNDAIVSVRAGGGGNIAIAARNLKVTGLGTRLRAVIGAGLGAVGAQAEDIDINTTEAFNIDESGVFNNVQRGGTGNAGDINITTGNLFINNGARLDTTTSGQGNGGNINITARDSVSFDGFSSEGFSSAAASEVFTNAIGKGGDINIITGSFSLTNGAIVNAGTRGQGDGGNINITVRDLASFDGVSSYGFSSGVFTAVESGALGQGMGQGGNINITTDALSLTNGAVVNSSTYGQGDAGNINITARDSVSFDGVGTNGVFSGADSSVYPKALGQGGSIKVQTGLLSITNGGVLSTSSEGQGDAGNIEADTRQLRLDNQGSIQAQTASGQGGNIALQVQDLLLLRQGGFISTTAGTAQSGGDGGNITFTGNFIVAVPNENSDISANAFTGKGGRVEINAQGIFGIQPRPQLTPLSDITASSEFGISGTVTLNTPNADPSRGTTTLPTGLVDTNALIANSCIARSSRQGRFTITGTGGVAAQPDDLANSSFPTYELVPDTARSQTTAPSSTLRSDEAITEPDGIYRLANGEVVLGRSCR
jgi:filamentous hemagglutinin family protein